MAGLHDSSLPDDTHSGQGLDEAEVVPFPDGLLVSYDLKRVSAPARARKWLVGEVFLGVVRFAWGLRDSAAD